MEANNTKAMREALENSNGLLEELAAIGEWGESAREQIAENNAALAAPARNCDIARDWIRDLYAHFQPPASIKREMPPEWVDSVMAFCRWLVAHATKLEGGSDGSK